MAKKTHVRAMIGGKSQIRLLIGGRWLTVEAAKGVATGIVAKASQDALAAKRERLRAILG